MTPTFNIYKAAVSYQQPKVTNDNLIILKIKEVINETTGITFQRFNRKTRVKEVVFSRQLFQYLCRKFTCNTLKNIGKLTAHNYGHWTILHSQTEIENIIDLKHRSENWQKVESAILRMTAYTGKIIL